MKTDLYDLTIDYILNNQENFYRLAYSYVRSKDNALDIVQNSICTALEKCYTIKNPEAIKTWLYRIIVNESLKFLKSCKKEIASSDSIPEQVSDNTAESSVSDVYNSVLKLEEPFKTVIILRYYEDMTLKQIAEITNTNLSTVKTRLYSGLSKLEKNLSGGI